MNKEGETQPAEMPGTYQNGDIPEINFPGKADATNDIPSEVPSRHTPRHLP